MSETVPRRCPYRKGDVASVLPMLRLAYGDATERGKKQVKAVAIGAQVERLTSGILRFGIEGALVEIDVVAPGMQ